MMVAVAGCSGGNGAGSSNALSPDKSVAAPPPLHLRSVSAHDRLRPRAPIRITFSAPLAPDSPLPAWSQRVPGRWHVTGNTAVFRPSGAYPPSAQLSLQIPGGPDGVRSAAGGRLPTSKTRHLRTPAPGVTFAEQILARLHYLPVDTSASQPTSPAAERRAVYLPPAGHFSWRWSNVPDSLRANWSPGKDNTVLRGALLAFQHQHGLTADGLLGPHTWKALLAADAAGHTDPWPYTYIYAVLDHSPQTLTLWRDGHTVLTSPVNGGVAGAPTPIGTFPIYERLPSTTMSGTNPDGSHYSDPGVPWVNYFSGGSAVHGFPRASYGSPQSVGCLELPIGTAHTVFDDVNYGTLVTVINIAEPPPVATPAAPSSSHTTLPAHHTTHASAKPSSSPKASSSPKPSPSHHRSGHGGHH